LLLFGTRLLIYYVLRSGNLFTSTFCMSHTIKNKKDADKNILFVGIGASAGGLDPLKAFFNSLPEKTGMAFIVVLHLSPDKESRLTEILQRETSLDILQVQEKTLIEKDHIYVIPPDKLLSVQNDHLELSDPKKKHGIDSIDLLFRTLARKKQKYSAGIILSGAGSDGVTGMKDIKKEGGITIAQDPDEAQHSSMPYNAIQTGAVDKVLPVDNIAEELMQYRETLYQVQLSEQADELSEKKETEKLLFKIFKKIRDRNEQDFSNYRRSSILRRLDRRMRVNRVHTISEYLDYLDKEPEEIDRLYKDLLISVTHFFRDEEAFKALEEKVIPKLFENRKPDDQIRIWVPGCATGEEAYSVAILVQEYASTLDERPEIQIFASDVDKKALEKARTGKYPNSIKNDISDERLNRFFTEDGEMYVVRENLRDLILFAPHDLLRNPPFSRIDLITCRNLLIYLNRDLQTEVFNLFHYALRKSGWLFLGKSDSRLGIENLFNPISKKYRIYRQKSSSSSRTALPDLPLLYKKNPISSYQNSSDDHQRNLEKLHWSVLVRLFSPQSTLISDDYNVIHSTDGIDRYLNYSGGEPSSNILHMVKPEIRQSLRSLLFRLKNEDSLPALKKDRIQYGDNSKKLELSVRRFANKDFPEGLIQVIFKEISSKKKQTETRGKDSENVSPEKKADIIDSLEKELEYTKEQLQLSIEEYETSNEELRASNEELQSMNEELQSTAEELETSQEELQSVNEELKTLNEQLESKVDELSRAHSDLENLMEATEVGIIFVDRDLCVKRFTSATKDIFNLIDSDIGRPLKHITNTLEYEEMTGDIETVLDDLEKIKKVVSTDENRWYIMRLHPYLSSEDKIEGVVISFTEFTKLKEARQTIEEQTFQESLATLGVYALEQEDLELIVHRAIQQTCALLELKCATIYKVNKENNTLKIFEQAGCQSKNPTLEIENEGKWDLGFTLASNKPVSVLDYKNESRFKLSPFMQNMGITSSAIFTIRGTNRVFGIFALYCKNKRAFSTYELHFMQVVANILGRSIEQNMIQKELQQAHDLLKNEMKYSQELQEDLLNSNILERWNLGGYLHDNFGQLLATVKILIEDIKYKLSDGNIDIDEEAGQINEIVDKCIADIRDVVHDIIPIDIEHEGVVQAFRVVMNRTYKTYGVRCILEKDEILNEIKNIQVATHLYHIVQEAFRNAATHGKANRILISPKLENDRFVLEIKDDGVGLESVKKGNGQGLRIMKHRMNLLGGTLEIKECSKENQPGTILSCTIPIEILKESIS